MSQVTEYIIADSPLTMAQLKTQLDSFFAAVGSGNKGSTAPLNPFNGMMWIDDAAVPWLVKIYGITNGWTITGSFNETTGVYAPINAGQIVQVVEATPLTTWTNSSSVIPNDDTIPQNSEGVELITVTVTPKSTTNRLKIHAHISYHTGVPDLVLTLFQDSIANALAVTKSSQIQGGVNLHHEMQAGTTSPITFKIRYGPDAAGSVYVNGGTAARLYGGILAVRLRVEEIAT